MSPSSPTSNTDTKAPGYGSYGNYGSYKREPEAEAAPEPIAEAEIVEKRTDYGKYGGKCFDLIVFPA